jgi:hypothetical protein
MEIGSNPVTDILIVLALFVAIVAFLFITFRIWGYFMRFFKEALHSKKVKLDEF